MLLGLFDELTLLRRNYVLGRRKESKLRDSNKHASSKGDSNKGSSLTCVEI